MRPRIPALMRWTTEPENGRRKCAIGTAKGSIVHRDVACFTLLAGIALVWIDGSEQAPRDVQMRLVQGSRQDLIMSLAISPDGKTMASCDAHGFVTVRDMLDWQSVRTYAYSQKKRSAWSLSFSADSKYLAVGGSEPGILLVDLRAGSKDGPIRVSVPFTRVRGLAFSPTGRVLAATSFDEGKTLLCDPVTGKTLCILNSTSVCLSIVFSPDGKKVAAGGRDGTICLWDVATGETKFRLEEMLGPILSVAFSPNGVLVASTSAGSSKVRLWETSTGRLIRIINANHPGTNGVAFSPDSRTLASGGNDGMLRLWNVETGHQRAYLDGRAILLRNVAFSADGHTLAATANDNQIRLWNAAELTDDLADAGGSALRFDRQSSNNPPQFANSYSGSNPRPVYSLDGLRASSAGLDLCLDG